MHAVAQNVYVWYVQRVPVIVKPPLPSKQCDQIRRFWKLLMTYFLSKVAQIYGDFWTMVKTSLLSKIYVATFWENLIATSGHTVSRQQEYYEVILDRISDLRRPGSCSNSFCSRNWCTGAERWPTGRRQSLKNEILIYLLAEIFGRFFVRFFLLGFKFTHLEVRFTQ